MVKQIVLGGVVAAVVVACSTKSNPNACCVSSEDCAQAGLSSMKSCDHGLTCVNNECIQETCATDGCTAAAPVCSAVTNACEACTDSSQCASYPGQTVCDTSSGACVGCAMDSDCPADKPVCDMNSCRACADDDECAMGACGDDGSCVAENEIVFLDPAGTDAGNCTSNSPCRSIGYGVTKTSGTRQHIVMHQGAYVENVHIVGGSTAPLLYIHGGGSTLSNPTGNDSATMTAANVDIRHLDIVNEFGRALVVSNGALHHAHVRSYSNGIEADGVVSLDDVIVEPTGNEIGVLARAGTLTLDRVQIVGRWMHAVVANDFQTSVNATNTLIYGTTDLALDLSKANGGTISFTTIADSGADMGTGPRAVTCSSSVSFRSSIIWAPGSVARAPIQGCNVVSSIAGPTAIPGVSNSDPLFVASATHDYHVTAGSPAIDVSDFGPDHDLDGDARPQGARYDIGADEAH